MSYPPEPWHLRGQMYLSVFGVPAASLPPLPAALPARPLMLGTRALVGVAWVRYEPGGTLDYHELLSATLVHRRGRPRVSITEIWVDSVPSRDGGRALWSIPKDLARIALTAEPRGDVQATATGGGPIAGARFGLRRRLPGRWPVAFSVVQALAGQVRSTPVRGRTGLRTAVVRWQPDPGGPLAYLVGRRPLITLVLTDFRLSFGPADDRKTVGMTTDRDRTD